MTTVTRGGDARHFVVDEYYLKVTILKKFSRPVVVALVFNNPSPIHDI